MKAPGSIYGFLIMVVIVSSVFFQDVYSQSPILDREIQIHEQTATVKNLLNEISISGGFSFSYGKDVPLNKKVRISPSNQSIRHHLEYIFKGDSLEFVEKGNKVLIIPVSPEPPKDIPKQTIRGKIMDLDSKIPLIGVNVVLGSEGPLKGTITDENGYFRFEGVPIGRHDLRCSYIGYEPRVISNFLIASGKEYVLNVEMEESVFSLSEDKKGITLEHMLTVSDGLEWYELEYLYSDERNTFRQWINNGGGIEFVINRPAIAAPGSVYSYNTGVSHVLSGILQKVTGTRTDSFALENLFAPLGIDQYYWPADGGGINYGGSGMQLTPRNMARFGYLYLRNGEWDGSQIVPADWVEASKQPHIKRKYIPDYYYGYHWWVGDDYTYSAVGYGGQWITIIPEHDLIVVFTNGFAEYSADEKEKMGLRDTMIRLSVGIEDVEDLLDDIDQALVSKS